MIVFMREYNTVFVTHNSPQNERNEMVLITTPDMNVFLTEMFLGTRA